MSGSVTVRRLRPLMVGLAVLIALAGFAFLPGNAGTKTHVTVELRSAVAVYPGDEVRVLGVPIGTIISITPQPSGAVAEIEFDSHVKVPANARAAVVSPSLVSTRYIQLVPAYRGGPQLQSGAVIPVTRTATPVEFDQLKASLSKLATDLGPLGTSRTGALGEALDVGAANLDGQGAALKTTIDQMGKAATTLSAGAPDLFSAVRNLNQFVGALNENDAQVRQFTDELSSFSNLLSDNRKQLGDMLRNLDSAVDKVQDFTNDNRGALHENVVALRKITTAVAQKRQSLADLIHIAPTAAEDFFHIYNPDTGALTGVLADSQLASPAQTICSAIYSAGGKPEQCISALSPFADLVRQYHLPILGADPSHSGPGALPAVTGMLFPGGN